MSLYRKPLPIFDLLNEEAQDYLIENKVKIIGFKLKHEVIYAKDYQRRKRQGIKNMYSMLRPGILTILNRRNEELFIKNYED